MSPESQTDTKSDPHHLINTLIRSILSALGPSLWTLYRQLMRNILRNWDGSAIGILSSQTLLTLLNSRPNVSFRHNDLARAMRGRHGPKIPVVELSIDVPDDVVEDYWRFCNDAFGEGVRCLAKWVMLVEAGEAVTIPKLGRGKDPFLNSPFISFFEGPEILTDEATGIIQKRKRVEILGGPGVGIGIVENVAAKNWATNLRNWMCQTKESKDPIKEADMDLLLREFRSVLPVYKPTLYGRRKIPI